MSYARGLLIVVYGLLSNHVIFMPGRLLPTAPQTARKIKSIKRFLELFFCQAPGNLTSPKQRLSSNLKCQSAKRMQLKRISMCRKNSCKVKPIIGEQVKICPKTAKLFRSISKTCMQHNRPVLQAVGEAQLSMSESWCACYVRLNMSRIAQRSISLSYLSNGWHWQQSSG